MRNFFLMVLFALVGCSGDFTIFKAGNTKICVPKNLQIDAPIWLGRDKDGSVAFSGCKGGIKRCSIPRSVDSVVLMPFGRFKGWRWDEFDKSAFYAKETVAAIRGGRFQYVDGRSIIKVVARGDNGVTLYWRAGDSADTVDELLMICQVSRNDGTNESGTRCTRMLEYIGFSVRYDANFDVVSLLSVDQIDRALHDGIYSWSCK
jgi:hypothetical protein